MPLNESVYRRKQREEEEKRRREQAVEMARGSQNGSSSSSNNSSSSSQNLSYGSQRVSNEPSKVSGQFESTARKYTRENFDDRSSGRYRTQRRKNSSYIDNRGNENNGSDKKDTHRVKDTLTGAGKQWLGGQLSSIGTTGQSLLTDVESIHRAKAVDDNPYYDLRSRENALGRETSAMDRLNRKEGVDIRNAERAYDLHRDENKYSADYRKLLSGTENAIRKGDTLQESGAQDIERAKEGANGFQKFLIEQGSQLTQWGMDAGLNIIPVIGQALSITSFMNRAGGMASYQARQEGMNPDQQFFYQQGSALAEGLSELTFQSVGALRATYGKGIFSIGDKLVNRASVSGIVNRLGRTELGKSLFVNMARLGGGALEEGLEEVETDLVDPLLKYMIKKSADPNAEFEGWDIKQMGYDFLMGATMGGVLGGVDIPRQVKADLHIVNDDAYNEGYTESLIKQASIQGRQGEGGRTLLSNSEILAEQFQKQIDSGKPLQPAQIRMLQEAVGQTTARNEEQLTRRKTEEYTKAEKSGNLVQMQGTRMESEGIDNASQKLVVEATEKAKSVIGENATEEEAEAVASVTTGIASASDIDTVLAKPELKKAVETIMNEGNTTPENAVSIPINNAEARDTLENLTAVNRIANRNTILKGVQEKNAETIKASIDGMSESGKDLFASRATEAENVIGSADIYRDRFSRLYTDGNTKGADFETSYNRIIGSLDSEALKSVFTKDFAKQIFDEGKKAIITDNAKESARSRAEEYANRKGGLTFENNDENLISAREKDSLQKFAERVGVEINVVKTLAKDANGKALMSKTGKKLVVNGKYQNGVITIASDAQNKLITVAKHELTHHLKETSPEMYQKLEDFVFERWYHGNAEEMEDEIARYMKLYSGQGLDRDGVREEIIADASEAFFTDEGAIQDAISFSEKLGRAIHDGIKTMLDAFLGLQDSDSRRTRGYGNFLRDLGILQEAERMWLEALEDSQQRKRNARGEVTADDYVDASTQYTTSDEKHSLVEDDGEIERLNSEQTQKSYRAMALIDGKLYPPMATKVKDKNGKWVLQQGAEFGQWIKSDITTDSRMFTKDDKFLLKKDNGDIVPASYNPYIHSSDTMLNDQFATAYKRPNIVVVEGDIPVGELSSGYRAEHDLDDGRHIQAKDTTGTIQWKAGIVQGKLTGTRTVFLTNHFKPTRIVPDSEVARSIQDMVSGTDVVIPYNVVTPSLRRELQKLGVKMEQSTQKGYQVDLTKYSVSAEDDKAYLDAVNRGDMETAKRLLDKYAKKAGYKYKGFHGTNAEFTRFDPEKLGSKNFNASSAYMGFFASKSKDTAESYTGLNSMDFAVLAFGGESTAKIEEIKKKLDYDAKHEELERQKEKFFNTYKKEHDYYEKVEKPLEEARKRIEEGKANGSLSSFTDEELQRIIETMSDFDRIEWNKEHLNDMYRAWESTPEYKANQEFEQKIWDEWEQYEIKRRGYVPHVLPLYIKLENPLVYDFEGGERDTESFAGRMARAKEEGRDGCIFKNVADGGDIDDIYTVFSNTQFKSAEVVTYDDDGDIIPLSERFNDKKQDTRWSLSADDQDYMDAVNKGDMETAQKMVDERARQRGYDIKAYHGTGQKFTRFDRSKQGSNYDEYLKYGNGFYFATTEKGAKFWGNMGKRYGGDNVMSVYLKSDRMLDAEKEAPDWAENYLIENGYNQFEANFITLNTDRFLKTLLEGLHMSNQEVQDLLISKGYDGIKELYRDGTGQLVVFYPVQIKSADPVTYDDNGEVIPLSKRFTELTDDIRYSVSEDSDGSHIESHSTGAYSGQVNMRSEYKDRNGKTLGYVDWVDYEGSPSISYIETDKGARRKGVAKKLLQDIQRQYPDKEIGFGMTTRDGTALLDSITYDVVDEEIQSKKELLESKRAELKRIEDRLNELFEKDNLTEEEDKELHDKGEAWNDLYYSDIRNLERELEGQKAVRQFVKMDDDNARYSVSEETETEKAINESMTMDQCRQMIQRCYNLADIRDWSDGEYKNGDEWLKGEGSGAVAIVAENDWSIQQKYLNDIGGEYGEDFTVEDIIDAYLAGTLRGKEKPKASRLDVSKSKAYLDNRFYSPKIVRDAVEALKIADQRVTKKNSEEVNKARAKVLLFAHNVGAEEELGLTRAELNKKLRSWSGYSSTARDISKRINSNVAVENRWTGIENMAWLSRATVSNEELANLVKDIQGDSSGYQRSYIARTMLALDTHINWKDLTFKFVAHPSQNRPSVRGLYGNKLITVKFDAPNSVAHEMGHALDHIWGEEFFGGSRYLTDHNRYEFDKIKDPRAKQFVENFFVFMDEITDLCDIRSDYTQKPTEVFARFIDQFCRWTETIATGRKPYSSFDYNDRFTQKNYVEFARLLQEKAYLDANVLQKTEDNLKFSISDDDTLNKYIADRQKRIDDGEQMSFFGSLNETIPSKPKEKTRAEKFSEKAFAVIADIQKKKTWSGREIKDILDEFPEFSFVERLNDKSDETATADFSAFLSSIKTVKDLSDFKWYFSKYDYHSDWKKSRRSGIMKFNKLIDKRSEEILAGKANGRDVGIQKRTYTAKEARDIFNSLNTDKELKALGEKVFDCIDDNFNVRFEGVSNIKGFNFTAGGTQGQAGGRTVHLNMKFFNSGAFTDQQKAETLLHESIHTITVYALSIHSKSPNSPLLNQSMHQACESLNMVYKQIKNDPAFEGEYGRTDVYEMVAELSNPVFRAKLKAKNLFDKILDAIRKLLYIQPTSKKKTAFDMVDEALQVMVETADSVSFDKYAHNISVWSNGKFSVSEEDENTPTPKQYQSTIAKLEEKVADLKSEFKRTDLKTPDPKQTRIQAGRLLKRHDSSNLLHGEVVDTFNKIHRLYKGKGMGAFDEVAQVANDMATRIVDNMYYIRDENEDAKETVNSIKDYIRNNPIVVTPEMKRNITDWGAFYKRNFGRIKMVSGEHTNLDRYYYQNLEKIDPEFFGEYYNTPAEMLTHIEDVFGKYDDILNQNYEMSTEEMREYIAEIASDIMVTAYDLQTKRTFADKKYEEKVKAVKKAREEALASRDRALEQQRQRFEEKIEAYKKYHKDYKVETKERAEKKRRINQIAGIHKRLLEKLQEPKDTKHLPDGYAPIVSNVLSMFDFTTEGMEKWAERYGEPSKRYRYLDELRKRLEKMSKPDSEETDFGIEIDPDLVEIIEELKADIGEDVRLSDLDSATLEDIYTLFKAFEHQINSYNKAFDERNRQTVLENRDEFLNQMRSRKDRKERQGVTGWMQRQLETNNTTPEDFFHLVGGTPEKLYRSIRKGFDKHILNVADAMTFIGDTVSGKEAQKWSENVRTYTTSLGDSIKLTDAQLMSIYCLSKREQAQQHMFSEKGGKGIVVAPQKVGKGLKAEEIDRAKVVVSSSDIQKWISQLSDKQREVADQFQKYLSDDMSKLGNETALKLYGYRKFTEKNYFPIQSSENWLNSTFDFSGGDAVLKNVGMTKAVNKFANNPIVIDDIFTVASKHISTMSLYNSLVPPLTDFQRFWNSKDNDHNTTVKQEFERVYGKPALQYVENFMRDLNGSYKRGFEVEGIDKLMSKYKQASIGLNLRVLFQQPTAIARAGAVMNPVYITKALGASVTTLKDNLRDMREHCPIALWKSWGFYNTDLARDMKSIIMDESKFSDNFSKAYGVADDLTWSVIFKAVRYEVEAQNKNLKVGSDEYWEKVNERASEVFDRTQVVDSPFHRSQNMRAKDNLSKMVTAFMAEPTKTYNMLKTELTLAKREIESGQKGAGVKRASRVVQVFVTNAILVSASSAVIDALRGVGGSGDDDKDKNWFERFLAHWWSNTKENINPLGLLPLFKDVMSVVQGYDITRMDMQALGRMVKSLQYMGEYIKDPESSKFTLKNEVDYFLQQSAYLVGIPYANIRRDVRGIAFSIAEAMGYDDLFFEEAKFKYQLNEKTKSKNQSIFAEMYINAMSKGNTELADKIKKYMTEHGVDESYITGKAEDYTRENPTEAQTNSYQRSLEFLEGNRLWYNNDSPYIEDYDEDLRDIALGITTSDTERLKKLESVGISPEQNVLIRLAMEKADKLYGDKNGSLNKDEKERALDMVRASLKLTESQKKAIMDTSFSFSKGKKKS